MICNGYDKVLELSHGDLIELDDSRGTTVRVTQGTVWLTQENDTQDVVLRPGDVWTVERQGLTLIEAQGRALVCLLGAGGKNHAQSLSVGIGDRLRNWVRSTWNVRLVERSLPYY